MVKEKKRLDDYIIEEGIKVNIDRVVPDEGNIRHYFTKKELESLASSIKQSGLIEPALVESKGRKYPLVSGHRRYWATLLGLQKGWFSDRVLYSTVVNPLPKSLRLKIQMAENDSKEKVPSNRIADSLWGRYQIMLAELVESQQKRDVIHESEAFWELPRELRDKLPVSEYARFMGKAASTVLTAFGYQKLHESLKKMVEAGSLCYSSACMLSRIPEKKEQKRVLALIRENGEPTKKRTNKEVKRYMKSLEKDEFMKLQHLSYSARPDSMRVLSSVIGEADRTIRIFGNMLSFDSSLLELRVNEERIGDILRNSYGKLEKIHEGLLEDEVYARRWIYKPRRNGLESLISELSEKHKEERERIMDLAKPKRVRVLEIHPNPLNPRGGRV